jgi:hypothetical protein
MTTLNTPVVFDGYKLFAGYKYHINFPDDWIMNELPYTGRNCKNCVGCDDDNDGHAMWRGIILGYCSNCAVYEYKYTRGPGFYFNAVEANSHSCNVVRSAFDTYLKNINLETIGDINENVKNTIENHYITKLYIQNHYFSDSDSESDSQSQYENNNYSIEYSD